ncbi:MAG TPA: efflux RND transporter periplasmic adaptor subunit [Candidatus Krumholzibacteria bacterium]|nr:efflux RND transporter periplasmic adaptor subunit [Candidatus Krumholzibacteria bacterium]
MIVLPINRVRPIPGRSVLLIVLGAAMVIVLSACEGNPGSGGETADGLADSEPLEVRTFVVEQRAETSSFVAAGAVAPVRRARMGTRQAGNVEQIMVEAGDTVEAGQALLRVDARDLEAALRAARLQHQAARTAWETARRNRERFQRLYDQRLIAKAELEEATLAAEDARGRLEQVAAEIAAVEVNLDYATLRAPFAGVVSEVLTDVGTFVAPGPPLIVFEDRKRLEINVGIAQARTADLAVGDTLQVGVEGLGDGIEGHVQAIVPALESPGVGQVLRLVVEDPPPSLEPGMIAEVQLPAARSAQSFVVVPASAILQRGQLDGVFLVGEDAQGNARATLRWVAVAPTPTHGDDGEVRVLRGLVSGDRVVVGEAVDALVDGQPVVLAEP